MRFRRIVLAVSVSALLFAVPAAAKGPTSSGACPANPSGFQPDPNVSASFSTATGVTSYLFSSLNESPKDGVPGLIKYCVYPEGGVPSGTTFHVDFDSWIIASKSKTNFAFGRPGGNKTNLPLDGKVNVEIGTATWPEEKVPENQSILLHVADAKECHNLYGADSPDTCFVTPGNLECTAGDTTLAYNANPLGVLHCPKSAIGFEATATNEFGDEVQVGTATTATRLIVEFNSFGCGDSGHWFNTDCVTTPGETFEVPEGITAKLYKGDDTSVGGVLQPSGTLLGTSTITPAIPYRPSADPACLGTTAPGGWFDDLAPVGSKCKNSASILLEFDFPSVSLKSGDKVVWTVQFNTSHSGYCPLLENPPLTDCPAAPSFTCPAAAGCGFDSLNVGDQTYDNAPYSGVDLFPDIAFISWWKGSGSPTSYPPPFGDGTLQNLQSQTGWTDFKPLGEILQKP